VAGAPAAGPADARAERFIDSVLSRLTVAQKVGQLVQLSADWRPAAGSSDVSAEQQAMVRGGEVGSFLNIFGSAATRELQRMAVEESPTHIPLIFGLDVVHGFRTTFPIPLAAAASWDLEAVRQSTRMAAAEAASAGIHWTFAPMLDIARDPRWGRIAEGNGEDPVLGAAIAEAAVRGYQGTSLTDPASIVACPKHYAAYGAAEGGRDYNTVDLSERTVRDVYLPPFRAAIAAGAGTIMASFNEIAGVPSSASRWLLSDVLRAEWGFDGFVVSDWNSVGELVPHGVAAGPAEAAAQALAAGLDMDMMSGFFHAHLADQVNKGAVSQATLDEAVRRVLRIKYRLGLFHDPYRGVTPERERATILHPSHLAAARALGGKSIVLLKNAGHLLPLSRSIRTLAVLGPLAASMAEPLGPWAAVGDSTDVVSVLAGIRAAAPGVTILHARGCAMTGTDTSGIGQAVQTARRADAVVLVVGEPADWSGEAASRSSLGLPGRQADLVRAVQETGKPVVLVLMSGRPLTVAWEAEHVPAIIEAWFLGVQTGNAVADVLFGAVNPSGKLPVTFPRTVGQVPLYYSYKNTGRPADDTLKFSSRYIDLPSSPLFPFGFGLSYTTFRYSPIVLEKDRVGTGDTVKAVVEVTNTGDRDGEEIVQVYVRDLVGTLTRPVKELKAFRRVHLRPGETSRVAFALPVSSCGFTGSDMKYRVEPGTFTLFVGPHSGDLQARDFVVMPAVAQ
jgi:beta-glucosidase